MPLSEKGKKGSQMRGRLSMNLPVLYAVAGQEMNFIVAVRAEDRKIASGVIKMVEIFVVAFKNTWDFVITALVAALHFATPDNARRPNFINVVFKSVMLVARLATKSRIFLMAFWGKIFTAKNTFYNFYRFSGLFKTALVTTARPVFIRRDCFKSFSTNYTVLDNTCPSEFFTFTPPHFLTRFIRINSSLHDVSIS